ncbi:MAG: hypothetical protein ACT4QC_12550 [Planctomycetaceae bacterium]
MVSRAGLIALVLFGCQILAGCGGYTDDNTPVKVITKDEIEQMHEAEAKIAELGAKGIGIAPPRKGKSTDPAKKPPGR